MIVAIPYHAGDIDLMRRWAAHVKKLGDNKNHTIILAIVRKASTDGIKEVLESSFGSVDVLECYHSETGWPLSCNMSFEQIVWHINGKYKKPFLLMEPDAVPLKTGWLDEIEKEYTACGSPFMGDFVEIEGIMPNGVNHMSGVAVYHWDMFRLAPSAFNNTVMAWDIASANHVTRNMHRTKLIQHDWIPEKKWRRDEVTKAVVRKDALIYHPDKLGVLFEDNLAGSGTRAEGEPSTGDVAAVGQSVSSIEQPEPASSQETILNAIDQAIETLYVHSQQSRKAKKEIALRLGEKGLAPKTKKAKSIKRIRKQVQAAVAVG